MGYQMSKQVSSALIHSAKKRDNGADGFSVVLENGEIMLALFTM